MTQTEHENVNDTMMAKGQCLDRRSCVAPLLNVNIVAVRFPGRASLRAVIPEFLNFIQSSADTYSDIENLLLTSS